MAKKCLHRYIYKQEISNNRECRFQVGTDKEELRFGSPCGGWGGGSEAASPLMLDWASAP